MSPPSLSDKDLWETVWGSGKKTELGSQAHVSYTNVLCGLGRGLPPLCLWRLSAIKWGSSHPHAHLAEGPRR